MENYERSRSLCGSDAFPVWFTKGTMLLLLLCALASLLASSDAQV
jgi:hypothetical protein